MDITQDNSQHNHNSQYNINLWLVEPYLFKVVYLIQETSKFIQESLFTLSSHIILFIYSFILVIILVIIVPLLNATTLEISF